MASGYALGAGSALLGKEMAMTCTIAVESVITKHYNDQIKELTDDDPVQNKELLDVSIASSTLHSGWQCLKLELFSGQLRT